MLFERLTAFNFQKCLSEVVCREDPSQYLGVRPEHVLHFQNPAVMGCRLSCSF